MPATMRVTNHQVPRLGFHRHGKQGKDNNATCEQSVFHYGRQLRYWRSDGQIIFLGGSKDCRDGRGFNLWKLAGVLLQQGYEALFIEGDVADEASAERALHTTVTQFGRLDILFNNAGVSAVGDVSECAPDDWGRVIRVNVWGSYLMGHYAVPIMRKQGQGTTSSTIAVIGLQSRAAYAASKGAILALTRAMAADRSHENIRVCALLPGTVYTPFVEGYLQRHYADNVGEAIDSLKNRQLNRELMTPQDVASAALYLASDEARFAFGTALIIDGGVSAAKVF